MHCLRGELGAAQVEVERGLAQATAGEHRAWLVLAPAHAEILLSLNDAPAAEREARAMLEHVRAKSLRRSCEVAGQRVLALALGRQQRHEAAAQAISHALSLARDMQYGGLPLAKLYESQAQIALWPGDVEACVAALGALWPLIERSEARTLLTAYERLRAESSKQGSEAELPPLAAPGLARSVESSTVYADIKTLLGGVDRREDRAIEALKLLLHETGAPAGHLLLLGADGLFAACSVNDTPASPALVQHAQRYLNLKRDAVDTVTEEGDADEGATISHGAWKLTPVLLENDDNGPVLTGLAMLATNDNDRPRAVRHDLVRLISQCLLVAGDTVALRLDDT
jgi:hypothetical protein